jgi:hypothetical protein
MNPGSQNQTGVMQVRQDPFAGAFGPNQPVTTAIGGLGGLGGTGGFGPAAQARSGPSGQLGGGLDAAGNGAIDFAPGASATPSPLPSGPFIGSRQPALTHLPSIPQLLPGGGPGGGPTLPGSPLGGFHGGWFPGMQGRAFPNGFSQFHGWLPPGLGGAAGPGFTHLPSIPQQPGLIGRPAGPIPPSWMG